MSVSHSCIYGLRASVLLARKQNEGFITIRELSDELDISFHFLTKVLQRLTHSQILESYKGPNGGVKLARHADKIRIKEIIECFEEDFTLPECALGLPILHQYTACPYHEEWQNLKTKIEKMISTITLYDLIDSKQKKLIQFKITYS